MKLLAVTAGLAALGVSNAAANPVYYPECSFVQDGVCYVFNISPKTYAAAESHCLEARGVVAAQVSLDVRNKMQATAGNRPYYLGMTCPSARNQVLSDTGPMVAAGPSKQDILDQCVNGGSSFNNFNKWTENDFDLSAGVGKTMAISLSNQWATASEPADVDASGRMCAYASRQNWYSSTCIVRRSYFCAYIVTAQPTTSPTSSPTESPTGMPTAQPTDSPSASPTANPTGLPTVSPTASPTGNPTGIPTNSPTSSPTRTGGADCDLVVDHVCYMFGGNFDPASPRRVNYYYAQNYYMAKSICENNGYVLATAHSDRASAALAAWGAENFRKRRSRWEHFWTGIEWQTRNNQGVNSYSWDSVEMQYTPASTTWKDNSRSDTPYTNWIAPNPFYLVDFMPCVAAEIATEGGWSNWICKPRPQGGLCFGAYCVMEGELPFFCAKHLTLSPTNAPSVSPTPKPTLAPSRSPTPAPTDAPTSRPTLTPGSCTGTQVFVATGASAFSSSSSNAIHGFLRTLLDELTGDNLGASITLAQISNRFTTETIVSSTDTDDILDKLEESVNYNDQKPSKDQYGDLFSLEAIAEHAMVSENSPTLIIVTDSADKSKNAKDFCNKAAVFKKFYDGKVVCVTSSYGTKGDKFNLNRCGGCDVTYSVVDPVRTSQVVGEVVDYICLETSRYENPCEDIPKSQCRNAYINLKGTMEYTYLWGGPGKICKPTRRGCTVKNKYDSMRFV